MTTISSRHLAASLATLFAVTTPAMAQPGQEIPIGPGSVVVITPAPVVINGDASGGPGTMLPPTAEPLAPQTQKWSDVSHINGQLVPVGEHSAYLYKVKKTNISTNPISWMFGLFGVSVSHAISDNVAIRGDVNIASFEYQSGYEIGASLPIYFRRVYSGPFIEPGIIARGLRSNESMCDFDCNSESMVGPEVMFGWHWTFDSGLNVAAAIGAARNMKRTTDEFGSSGDEVQPAGYFRVGYAF